MYDFNKMIEAYWQEKQSTMDIARRHASLLMSVQVESKDQSKVQPEKIWPLPIDEKTNPEPTDEERKRRKKEFKDRVKRLKENNIIPEDAEIPDA